MTGLCFVDTNVLVYAEDDDEPAKRDRARALLRELVPAGRAVLSLQVLRELFAASRKRLGFDSAQAKARVERYAQLEIARLDLEDLLAAIDLHQAHGFSIWDALIVQAASKAGCEVLYSEDLQHGRRICGLEIVNPFLI